MEILSLNSEDSHKKKMGLVVVSLIQVLDDSDDESIQWLIKVGVSKWNQGGINIIYRHRLIRTRYEAGNLNSTMSCDHMKDYEFIGNLHKGTNVAQILSGSNVDDFSAPYISAVENFGKEAHAVFVEFGGRVTLGDASTDMDTPATATGSLVQVQPPSVVPLAPPVSSSLPPKTTGCTDKISY